MLASNFGTGQVLWDMLWFFLFVIWIWLLIGVFADIVRSHDLSGAGKAIWLLVIVILPYIGILLYLIVRGDKMHEHAVAAAEAQDVAAREYIRAAAGSTRSAADELARLDGLRKQGVIDDTEFQRLKSKLLDG